MPPPFRRCPGMSSAALPFLLWGVLASVFAGRAAPALDHPDAPPRPAPAVEDGLPPVLVETRGGHFTREHLRAAVLAGLRAGQWPFDIHGEFVYHALIRLAEADAALPPLPEDAYDEQYRAIVEQMGGENAFAAQLARVHRTLRDYRRIDIPAGARLHRLVRRANGWPDDRPVDPAAAQRFLERQKELRRPQWHGFDARMRVLTLDGRDYGEDDMVAFAVQYAPTPLFQKIFDSALRSKALADEARRRAVASPDALVAERLDDASLRALYERIRPSMAITAVSYILIPLTPGADALELDENPALAEARRLRNRLRAPEADFAALARQFSVGAAADQGGFMGYLTDQAWIPRWMPASSYHLDLLPNGQSPLLESPHPVILETIRALKEHDISDPVLFPGRGYALLRRGPTREAPPWDMAVSGLRAWQRAEAVTALVDAALADAQYHWTPGVR